MTATIYSEERFTFVQSAIRPLGVPLSRTTPYFDRFMAACLKAEIEHLDLFFDREGGKMVAGTHPDAIEGRWREAVKRVLDQQVARIDGQTQTPTRPRPAISGAATSSRQFVVPSCAATLTKGS